MRPICLHIWCMTSKLWYRATARNGTLTADWVALVLKCSADNMMLTIWWARDHSQLSHQTLEIVSGMQLPRIPVFETTQWTQSDGRRSSIIVAGDDVVKPLHCYFKISKWPVFWSFPRWRSNWNFCCEQPIRWPCASCHVHMSLLKKNTNHNGMYPVGELDQ